MEGVTAPGQRMSMPDDEQSQKDMASFPYLDLVIKSMGDIRRNLITTHDRKEWARNWLTVRSIESIRPCDTPDCECHKEKREGLRKGNAIMLARLDREPEAVFAFCLLAEFTLIRRSFVEQAQKLLNGIAESLSIALCKHEPSSQKRFKWDGDLATPHYTATQQILDALHVPRNQYKLEYMSHKDVRRDNMEGKIKNALKNLGIAL